MRRNNIIGIIGCAVIVSMLAGCGQTKTQCETQAKYMEEGYTAMANGDYEAGAKAYEASLANAGGEVGAVEIDCGYRKAVCYNHMGKTEEAIETLTKLLEYDDTDCKSYFLRGSMKLESGDESGALADYNLAIDHADGDFDVFIGIYDKLNQADQDEYGKDLLFKAVKMEASTAKQYCQKGRICLIVEDYEQAKLYLDKAINGGYDEAKLYMASLLEKTDKADQAKAIYESYAQDHQGDAAIQFKLGQYYANNEQWEEAVQYYEQSIDDGDSTVKNEARLGLVKAYEHIGQYDKAYQELQAYVKNNSNNEEANRELVFLKTRVQED